MLLCIINYDIKTLNRETSKNLFAFNVTRKQFVFWKNNWKKNASSSSKLMSML